MTTPYVVTDDPDTWTEDEWGHRLVGFRGRHPDVDPMHVVEAINRGHLSLDVEGRIVNVSDAVLMWIDLQEVVSAIEGTS